jgi:hypothetical protein
LLTVGYGDFNAYSNSKDNCFKNVGEMILAIIWMILGAGFYSFTISNLSSVLSNMDTRKTALDHKLSALAAFCKEMKIEKNLRNQLKRTVEYSSRKNFFSMSDKQQIFSELPTNITSQIAKEMYSGIIQTIKFFQDKDSTFIGLIVPLL